MGRIVRGGLKPTPPSLPADSLTPAPTPAPTPALTPPPNKCSSIAKQVTNAWCQENCTQNVPPYCPTGFCKCTTDIPLFNCPTVKGENDFYVKECQRFVDKNHAGCCKVVEGDTAQNKCYNTATRECCPNSDGFNNVCPIGKCSTRPGYLCD
jgi:hypothetical protein